jgi:hypothetical protein
VLITPVGYSSGMRSAHIFTVFWLFVALMVTGMQATKAMAEVYKRVNPDGSVEFSDVPDKKGEKPIAIEPSSSYSPPKQPLTLSAPKGTGKKVFAGYDSLNITQPEDGATIRDNTGNLTVSVTSSPALQDSDSYVLLMDGSKVGEGRNGTFKLNNLPRGSHTLTVQIQDGEGSNLIQSGAVTFNLKRFSKLLKPHK